MRLHGKAALVTGSSRGIGRGIALRLAREGADVVVNFAGSESEAHEVVQEITLLGRRSVSIQADLRSASEASRLVAESIWAMGTLDLLVNNAGGGKTKGFLDVSEEDYDSVVDLNLKGVFFVTQAFARHLVETKKEGRVVNISSIHEELPLPGQAAYGASKGGVQLLTRDLAIELSPNGITVNSVAPGAIATASNAKVIEDHPRLDALLRQIPLRRLGTPEDVAGVVAFLLSDDAAYVTGSTYYVDGGLTWFYEE